MAAPRPRLVLRAHDEDGQTTVLTIGLTAVVAVLVLVLLAATAVLVQARTVQSLVDGAALAGAEELAFQLDQDPRVVLDEGAVQSSVAAHLDAVGAQEAVPGLSEVSAHVAADGVTVVVRARASVSVVPPAAEWVRGIVPITVPVDAEGSSRTVLTR